MVWFQNDWEEPGGPPPGSPPTRKFDGPWFQTQLFLSFAIGSASFLIFSYCRTRWPLLFAPRTKLKGFSPHEAHAHQAFFGWILPTIRISELTILQIVGLDAAVLLNFFKMSFYLFSVMSLLSMVILMPINYKNNIDDDGGDDQTIRLLTSPSDKTPSGGRDWLDLLNDANSYLSLHLCFTYLFTLLAMRFIYETYKRFIRARQIFSLEVVHSIAARTVLVTSLPNHLRGERTLAVYFENMGLSVESVSVCREVSTLKDLLDRRTKALLKLEAAWVEYLGNPSTVKTYDQAENAPPPLVELDNDPSTVESQPVRFVVPNRKRPTIRPGWFTSQVDALEYLEKQFKEADEAVKKKRRSGKFKATHVAFVTFEKMSSAQIASQVVHAASPSQCITHLAPEPRDIVWANMAHSVASLRVRETIVLLLICLLFFFWIFPIAALASLLSYEEIKKTMPWLGQLIDSNQQLRAIVQNVLPSVAMITLNGLLPFILEALTYAQGYRARSWIEYSLLRKYFLFLLVNVVFIFLLASTYWQLIRDLAESPAKVPEKLAQALQQGRARHFFLSYVILQGLGIMPLQLLNLGVIIPRLLFRIFITRTPRDFAELNAPPMINYGVVYPQAILVFVVTLLYSIIQPVILIFGAVYFGIGYVVYKYNLLFVFYKPYESQGQAWPITAVRLVWGIVIFQIFMTGIFILKKGIVLPLLMVPLIAGTVFYSWHISGEFTPLSKYVNLSAIFEVQRGEETEDVLQLRVGHPVTWSQSNLNHRRYAQNDDTLYVAPEDERTDYSQPPMSGWYDGVLNTGKRRYAHPALNGVLPQPWLPLKKGQTLVNRSRPEANGAPKDEAVVLTLRKRFSAVRKSSRKPASENRGTAGDAFDHNGLAGDDREANISPLDDNPWSEGARLRPRPLNHRLSFDGASGVIVLPEDGDWIMEEAETDSDEDYGNGGSRSSPSETPTQPNVPASSSASGATPSKQRHGTYYHHPERRRQTIPGAFPR
ncbi:DUF221-domain-containing protein [Rickenella mellea]|uniref:DUF221-domain-containing protein n=1 Tax=Rickenella mellea TaxID=50990 RepID=A0A4Y7Q0D1_9AGAM|nr:DUF221-domain-containing protein [Rickenella mellea]